MLDNTGSDMGTTMGGQFAEGVPVYDADGNKVGDVSEHGVQHGCLVVHHGFFRQDVYVPLNAVTQNTANGVNLSLNQDQFNALPHNQPPADQATEWTTVQPGQTTGAGVDQMVAPVGEASMPTTLPPNQPTDSLVAGEVSNEGVTMQAPDSADNVGDGMAMNETGGWSNLGERDLETGAPASAQVQGATPSFPDGNNVAGTREGPELLQPQDTVGGTPVGNATGVMGTGAGPVGTSMGPGVLGSDQGDVTVNASGPVNQGNQGNLGNTPDMQDTTADAMPNATPLGTGTSLGQSASTDAAAARSGLVGSGMTGSGDTSSDVIVNGQPLPSGQDAVLGSGGLIGSRDTGANATSGIVGPETGDTVQTDSGLVGIGDQGATDSQRSQSGFEGMAGQGDVSQTDSGLVGTTGQNAITNSTAGTEYTSVVDPDMAGALPQSGGPLDAGPQPMGGLAQSMTPGDMGDVSTHPIVDQAPPTGANPDLVEAATNSNASDAVGTVGAAPSGIVAGYGDSSSGTGVPGSAANTGPDGTLTSAADTGVLGSGVSATGDTLPANLAQGGAQTGQDTLADQLRADQPVGDVLSPEENTNQPPA